MVSNASEPQIRDGLDEDMDLGKCDEYGGEWMRERSLPGLRIEHIYPIACRLQLRQLELYFDCVLRFRR